MKSICHGRVSSVVNSSAWHFGGLTEREGTVITDKILMFLQGKCKFSP